MKFIVYCTTNIVNKKIYIGVHKTENPDKFDGYLGCSVRATQPSTYMNPKTAFQYAVKKYGTDKFSRSILYVYDTAEEALLARLKKEQELCGEYGPNKDLYYVLNHPSPIKELHKYINSLEGA